MNRNTLWNTAAFLTAITVVVFSTLAYGTVHQPVIAVYYVFVALILLALAIDGFFSGKITFSVHTTQLPIILLALYGILQAVPFGTYSDPSSLNAIPWTLSRDPFATITSSVHLLFLAAFFAAMLALVRTPERLSRLVGILTVFGFVYSFYSILQMVLSPDKIYGIYKPAAATPFGSFVNRHDHAAIVEMTIALPLGMLLTGAVRPDKRLLYIVAAVLMGASLMLSGSRGGLVALVAAIAVMVIVSNRGKRFGELVTKAALAAMLLIGAVVGAVFVGGDTSLTRFADTAASDDITSDRAEIWSNTARLVVRDMPFGSGLGAFAASYTAVDTASGFERVEQAHNDYLELAATAGVVGLVCGGWFLWILFRDASRIIRDGADLRRGIAVGAFGGIAAILVHSAFDFVLHITAVSVMFLTLLAALVAAGRESSDKRSDVVSRPRRRKGSVAEFNPRT